MRFYWRISFDVRRDSNVWAAFRCSFFALTFLAAFFALRIAQDFFMFLIGWRNSSIMLMPVPMTSTTLHEVPTYSYITGSGRKSVNSIK